MPKSKLKKLYYSLEDKHYKGIELALAKEKKNSKGR
jgi:hypothetical protein